MTHPDDEDEAPRRAGADVDADEGEPDIEPFATGGEPRPQRPEHGYGYE